VSGDLGRRVGQAAEDHYVGQLGTPDLHPTLYRTEQSIGIQSRVDGLQFPKELSARPPQFGGEPLADKASASSTSRC